MNTEQSRAQLELYSIQEKRVYTEGNTKLIKVNGVMILATPAGEPLVNKVR